MPLRTGDIDELSDYWSDENSERGNGNTYGNSVHGSVEETRVGTQASFEQMLERELAKEQAQNGGSAPRRGAAPAKPRKQFLKKGARGWWMENPNAKQKMQRHVLESVELDDNNQAVRAKAAKAPAQPHRKPLSTDGRRSPQTSSVGTTSPEPMRRQDAAPVDISPVRLAPPSVTAEERSPFEAPRRSLATWTTANANVRESVETLNMSGVRQDFEIRREREAHELADFEALEQELAAEKESYLREKMEVKDRDSKSYYADDDDASWLRDSEDAASLQGESRHLLSGAYQASYNNLDLGGESSMVFDSDHVFRSPMPRNSNARGSVRPRQSRPSFAPSDISAVSLNDSEPWGDANVLDHFSNLPESPIAKHGMASIALGNARQPAPSHANGSRNHDSQWNGRSVERSFEDDNYAEAADIPYDDYDFESSTDRADSPVARRSMGRHDAPVSSLVQQVFGGAREAAESCGNEDYHSREQARTDHQQATGKVTSKKSLNQRPKEAQSVQGRKVSRPPSTRAKNSEQEQLDRGARKRVPGLSQTGILPVSIEEKLAELEEEVKFYKSETLQLQRKKSQFDEELQRIAREKESIVHFQEEQRQLIAQEWHQQRQKMKHEEQMFERQMKLKLSAAASAGSRKDRAEIDALKAQIVALQLEAKQASSKMKSTNDVLRQRIAELEGKNRELSEEIKFLERDRLDQWQKYEDLLKELNSQKPKQDGDRVPVKTVGDVTRVGRSAEQLLGSLRFSAAQNVTDSRRPESLRSSVTTPMFDRGDDYNPSRYSNSEVSRSGSARSSQAGSKHSKEGDDDDRRDSASVGDGDSTVDEVVHPGGKREITYRDGTKRIFFADGNEKEILPNGNVVIRFTNGDRKEYFPDTGVSVYHYHEAQTKLTSYPDKTKVYEFPNQQIEKSYPDGTTEIQFADGITKTIHPGGDEFSKFPDGTTMLETKDGLREVTLLNGKRVRYYPDGKMTLVTVDAQESEVRSDEELRQLMESM